MREPGTRKGKHVMLAFSCTPNRSNIELFSGRSGADLGPPGRNTGSKRLSGKLFPQCLDNRRRDDDLRLLKGRFEA